MNYKIFTAISLSALKFIFLFLFCPVEIPAQHIFLLSAGDVIFIPALKKSVNLYVKFLAISAGIAAVSYVSYATGEVFFLYLLPFLIMQSAVLLNLKFHWALLLPMGSVFAAVLFAGFSIIKPLSITLVVYLAGYFIIKAFTERISLWKQAEEKAASLSKKYSELEDAYNDNIIQAQVQDQEYTKIISLMQKIRRFGRDNGKNIISNLVALTHQATESVCVSYYSFNETSRQFDLVQHIGNNSVVIPRRSERAGEGFIGSRYDDKQPFIKPVGDIKQMGTPIKHLAVFPFKMKDDTLMGVLNIGFGSTGKLLEKQINRAYIIYNLAGPELERIILLNRLRKSAETDAMTGLFNRAFFDRRFPLEIDRAKELTVPLSLVLIDIDYFKQINDTYGHYNGDEVLEMLSGIIMGNIRSKSNDFAARLGGDEFCLLLSGAGQEKAVEIARNISEEYQANCRLKNMPVEIDGHKKTSSLSIGVASFPNNAATSGDLYKEADKALYKVKKTTKNGVAVSKAVSLI